MPNHTTNTLTIIAPDEGSYAATHALIYNEEGRVDFNVLVPMPEILHKVISPVRYDETGERILLRDGDDFTSPPRPATDAEMAEILACAPHLDWYNWACANWGTKWNAYDTEPDSDRFNTAWDKPRAWMAVLESKLPAGVSVEIISQFEGGEPTEVEVLGDHPVIAPPTTTVTIDSKRLEDLLTDAKAMLDCYIKGGKYVTSATSGQAASVVRDINVVLDQMKGE